MCGRDFSDRFGPRFHADSSGTAAGAAVDGLGNVYISGTIEGSFDLNSDADYSESGESGTEDKTAQQFVILHGMRATGPLKLLILQVL